MGAGDFSRSASHTRLTRFFDMTGLILAQRCVRAHEGMPTGLSLFVWLPERYAQMVEQEAERSRRLRAEIEDMWRRVGLTPPGKPETGDDDDPR
jgi:hypothetical protein